MFAHAHAAGPETGTWPSTDQSSGDLTRLVIECSGQASRAAEFLFPIVYDRLRSLAACLLNHERPDHTLHPTALVHEAYLKMVDQKRATFRDRAHFLAVAARAMRRILVDHARTRNRLKRGGKSLREPLADDLLAAFQRDVDLLELDEAMERLGKHRPRAADVVELMFFGALTTPEAAEALEISPSTVEREWRYARAWLYREMSPSGEPAPEDGANDA